MDLLTWLLIVVVVFLLLGVAFVRYQSAYHDTFQKMGIDTPQPVSRLLGHFNLTIKHGVFGAQTEYYKQFKDKKVYGWYDIRTPLLIIRDLDMVKDVMVKHFNCFVDRRRLVEPTGVLKSSMLTLCGDHWKRVRNTVSPTFSSGRVKKMSQHVERKAQQLVEYLREKQERNEEMDLKDVSSNFTLDVIASTAFGLEANTLQDDKNTFALKAKNLHKKFKVVFLIILFFPKLAKVMDALGISMLNKENMDYLVAVLEAAIEMRKTSGQAGKYNDFLDLLINADKGESEDEGASGLTKDEIISQAVIFLFAGLETVANVLSFTTFLLAVHPDVCKKTQEEIKQKIGKEKPDYENVQNLTYLDMCINESMRMFPPGVFLDRQCTEDVDIDGIHIPKGMIAFIPVYAIHHDPDIWPEPDKFDPERFSSENKESRHQYAHLPFGYGPRNCVGMRLALLELKVALASTLQAFTPVRCDKTVYPVTLSKMQLAANDGLWVKMEANKGS